jgi:hypothetical protein
VTDPGHGLRVCLSDHARLRAEQMGLPTKPLKRLLAEQLAGQDYPSQTRPATRVVAGTLPDGRAVAIPYLYLSDGTRLALTILWDRQCSRAS